MAEEHGGAGPVGAADVEMERERVALDDVEAALVEVAAALERMG